MARPIVVERNRANWTAYWNDLKPALDRVRSAGLAELALEDGGYFAGHVVAAGNPVDSRVRSILLDGLKSPADRPHYLAVLVTPGSQAASNWRDLYSGQIGELGYSQYATGAFGAIYLQKSH